MKRRAEVVPLLVLLGLGLAYQLTLLNAPPGLIDEGHLANAARRIASGEVLYRDIYTVYPPASFYVTSLLFHVFGTSLIAVRAFHVALTLALAGLVYAASRRLMPLAFSLLAGALVVATGWQGIVEGNHYACLYGAMPMAALLLLARADGTGRIDRWQLLTFGGLAGLTLAFRLEPFVGLAAAVSAVIALREGLTRRAIEQLAWVAIGIALVALPIGFYFVAESAWGDLSSAVFWTSFGQYLHGGEFNLPIPELQWVPAEWTRRALRRLFVSWEFRIPVVLYAGTFIEVAWVRRRGRRSTPAVPIDPAWLQRLALALFGSVLFLRATGRSDYFHLAPVLFPAYVLGVDLMARLWTRVGFSRDGPWAYVAVTGVLASSLWLHEYDRPVRQAFDGWSEGKGLDALVADVESRTQPGEPIVVLPWSPIVYFLTERPNPTKYDWLFPGYLTDDSAVSAFLAEIDRAGVEVVVYSPVSIDGRPDRSLAGFAPEIDLHLRREFVPVARFGRFLVLKRSQVTERPAEPPTPR